jgi:NADH-quinone oxidoreductase subunit L
MFEYAWIILALPAAGVLINLFFGKYLSQRVVATVATSAIGLAFLATFWFFYSELGLLAEERDITVHLWDWITIGSFQVSASMLLDPLSLTMALMVTGVAALIHLYSISYMHGDERYRRFFLYLNFFVLAMLILVFSDNFVMMFVGWEGVGLASFLLIGFWFDRRDDSYGWYADAGKKAFLVNRVGDFGFIVAMIVIWSILGTLNFGLVNEAAEHSALTLGAANVICLLLLLAATGKSAQIPLYVWLPDAMAGPTPVSALIHAATMVTAGIYMVARTHAVWHVAVDVSTLAAWIGGLTAFFAATLAIVQVDLKKILAYSTISQLGFMVMGVGVGAYGAAMFLLLAHAFYKALLFLAAGSVMHATDGVLDIRRMGGLRHKMPSTWRTFMIGAAALAGIPPLAGFFSKDAVFLGTLQSNPILYAVALITAALTGVYSFRALFLTFHGAPRDAALYNHVHESPSLMTVPLWILAFLSIFGGVMNLPFLVTLERFLEPSIGAHSVPSRTVELTAITLSFLVAVIGFVIAHGKYMNNEPWAQRLAARFGFLEPALAHTWYVDDVYSSYVVLPLRRFSTWLATVVDQQVIDGAVNGVANLTGQFGGTVRKLENGAIPTYALSILIGAIALIAYFLFSI